MLWQAVAGQLWFMPPFTVARSGLIGPLVELAIGHMAMPEAYHGVSIEPPIYSRIERALAEGAISGAASGDRAGVFPLSRFDLSDGTADNLLWDQWAMHTENAAVAAGVPRHLSAGLMGAIGELRDNVVEHSGRPRTGLVAYGAGTDTFEFVVADAGRGVLASLRENPQFTHITDCGSALRTAASDGVSRYADGTGHGYGIGQLFRALARHAAELRFRSGDHVLRLWGDAPSLTGHVELAQKAWLNGLTISVRCALWPGRKRPSENSAREASLI